MSRYTTELRYICENLYDGQNHDALDIDEIITDVVPKIFNFNFPIFDETYRQSLCEKIIRHFYTQEIGYETVALWHLKLKTKMLEIMPYYNQLYNSTLLEFDAFNDADYEVDVNNKRNLDGTRSSTNTNDYTHKYSRTPQGGLTGLLQDKYLTDAIIDNRSDTGKTSDSFETIDANKEKVKGKRSFDSYSKRLMEFRETFLNIDMQVINELEPLFMGIW